MDVSIYFEACTTTARLGLDNRCFDRAATGPADVQWTRLASDRRGWMHRQCTWNGKEFCKCIYAARLTYACAVSMEVARSQPSPGSLFEWLKRP